LFTKDILEKNDPDGMHSIYDGWAEIARNAYNSDLDSVDFNDIDHVVFSGMGGSGSVGDLFSSVLSKTNIHTTVVKGYELPNTIDKNTLVVVTSVSGNTVETLTTLDTANKKDCNVIAFSSGGKIESFCTKNNIEFRKFSQMHSPRASLPIFVYSILKTLNSIIPITKQDIANSLEQLEHTYKEISSTNLHEKNPSIALANWINGIPVIYYPHGLETAAVRFKNSLQENAKTHAITENVVESSHNGIVSWEKPSSMIPILIEGKDDHIKTKDRWKILREYFEKNGIKYKEILTVDGNILSKIMCLIYTLDYSTIYYSVQLGVNPSPIRSIDFIKERL